MHFRSPAPGRIASLARLLSTLTLLASVLTNWTCVRADNAPEPLPYAVRNWRVDDGLPDNTVNRIVQDKRGFLWLATAGGLTRFDGMRFQDYPLPQVSRDGGANIRDLVLDSDGGLLLLPATGGILRYRDGGWSDHPASAALQDRQLLFVFPESNGALWIVPSGSEIIRWERGTLKRFGPAEGFNRRRSRVSFAHDEDGRTWIAAADFLAVYEDGALHRWPAPLGRSVAISGARAGGFWVATDNGLLRMEHGALHAVPTGDGWAKATDGLQDLFEAADGSLWFASRRYGVSRFAHGAMEAVPTSHQGVLALTGDDEGNIWAATSGAGIDRIRPQPFVQIDARNGLPDKVSTSVCEDATGTIWVANRRGGLVAIASSGARAFAPPGQTGEFFANVVYPGPDGTIWVGSAQGVFRLKPGANAQLEAVAPGLRDVHVLFVSPQGDVWIGAGEHDFGVYRDGAFHAMSKADGYTGHRVKCVVQDSQGKLFVATDDRQVFALAEGRLVPTITKDEMPGGLIAAALCDEGDLLWLATSHGVVLRRNGMLHLFTTAQGLPDDVVFQLLADNRGSLWFGSRRGLFSVRRADLLAVADGTLSHVDAVPIGRDEGLPGASALNNMQPMSWRARDGRLWFTTYEGVVGVDPAASIPTTPSPRVYIDRVRVNHNEIRPADRIRLGPGTQQLTFQLAALNYSAPERVRVRHRLVGYDFDWVETGRDRRAVYSRLPPGDYRLEATAANAGGSWGPVAHLSVVVVPSWWQTWWARCALIALFTTGVAAVARYWSVRRLRLRLERLEREHALEKERARIARNLHDELGGSLTQIGMLADRVRRRATESEVKPALVQLSWRTRRLADELESIVWTVNPGNNTWDKLAAFIDQYTRGFCRDTSLRGTVEGTERIPNLPLAPEAQHNILSVVKEALTNTLKHAQASEVLVEMNMTDEAFELRIRDNGIGFDPAAAEHNERNGLKNMRSRMSELSGTLEVRSVRDGGTEILLRLPLTASPTRS